MTVNDDSHSHHLSTESPHEAAQAGLKEWHRIVACRDWKSLTHLLADEVVFRNPASYEAFHGHQPMIAILEAVFSVMQDFSYLRHFASRTGYVLEFRARVENEEIYGADLIEFNDEGKITDFMVMIRPADVVSRLSSAAARHLALSHLP